MYSHVDDVCKFLSSLQRNAHLCEIQSFMKWCMVSDGSRHENPRHFRGQCSPSLTARLGLCIGHVAHRRNSCFKHDSLTSGHATNLLTSARSGTCARAAFAVGRPMTRCGQLIVLGYV